MSQLVCRALLRLYTPTHLRVARGLEEPNTLRWRATFRSRATLAARSAIRAVTALDVNGDHDPSPVAGHAATEVSPPIQNASPWLVPLHWLGAHVVLSLGVQVSRAHVARTCIPGASSACRVGEVIALLELEMPSGPTRGSCDVPKHCGGRTNE